MEEKENVLVKEFLLNKEQKILEFVERGRNIVIAKIPYADGYESLYANWYYGELKENEGKYRGNMEYKGILDMETGEVFDYKYGIEDYVTHGKLEYVKNNLEEKLINKVQELYENGTLVKIIEEGKTPQEIEDYLERNKENIKWEIDRIARQLYVEEVKPKEYKIPVKLMPKGYTILDLLRARKDEDYADKVVERAIKGAIENGEITIGDIKIYEGIKKELEKLLDKKDEYLDIIKALNNCITPEMMTVRLIVKLPEGGIIKVGIDTVGIKCLSPHYDNETIALWRIGNLKEREEIRKYMKEIKLQDIEAISYRGKYIYEKKEVA